MSDQFAKDSKDTTTAVSNRRRSQRVFLNIRVVARFHLLQREWIVEGETRVVNAHGGTVQLSVAPMAAGVIIVCRVIIRVTRVRRRRVGCDWDFPIASSPTRPPQ